MNKSKSLLFLSVLTCCTVSQAQDGSLFTSFGNGGTVVTNYGSSHDYVTSMYIQPDGKVVLAGWGSTGSSPDYITSRFNADGTPDNSFNGNGKLIARMVTSQDYAYSVLGQTDGKLILAGNIPGGTTSGWPEYGLCRLNTNGSFDATFGTAGKTYVDIGPAGDWGATAVLQSDGKIIMCGYSYNLNWKIALVRLNSNGTIDNTFGTSGKAILPWDNATAEDQPLMMKILSSGKLMFATYKINGSFREFYLLRANADGTIDNTFDSDGIAQFNIGAGDDLAVDFIETTGGKIYVAGRSNTGSSRDFSILKLNADGSLDNTFDGDGIKTIDIGAGDDVVYAITEQADGKILVTGGAIISGNTNIAVVRLNANGSFDNTFDSDGIATFDYQGGEDIGAAINQQADGTIIVGAMCYTAGLNMNANHSVLKLAANGAIDNTYGTAGFANTNVATNADNAYTLGRQSDGKIITASNASIGNSFDIVLSRFNTDGTYDNTFGTNGAYLYSIGSFLNGVDKPAALKILVSNKILIATQIQNTTGMDIGLLMFNSNGTPDNTWGTAGRSFIDFGTNSNDDVTSMAIQGDGKILLGGHSLASGNWNFIVVRFNADGSIDNTFGTSGKVSTDIGSASLDQSYGIVVQPDGKIILAGTTNASGNNDFALIRLNSDGTPDNSFDTDGKLTTDITTSHDNARAVLLQPDGKIIVAGYGGTGSALNFLIARYNTDGTPDNTFDTDGKVNHDLGSYDQALSAVLQGDGKIVLGGLSNFGLEMALARYNSDGTADNTFGSSGSIRHTGGASSDQLNYIELLPDGNLIGIGTSNTGMNNDVVVAKFSNTIISSLPLTWGEIFLQSVQEKVIVNWSTLSEQNTASFDVEHKSESSNWQTVTVLAAKGFSPLVTNYSVVHNTPVAGKNAYRIKQVDKDGKFTYSIIKSISVETGDKAISLASSNVAESMVLIRVHQPSGSKVNLALLSANGQLLWKKAFSNGTYSVDLTPYKSGIFYLKAAGEVIKLIKN